MIFEERWHGKYVKGKSRETKAFRKITSSRRITLRRTYRFVVELENNLFSCENKWFSNFILEVNESEKFH